MIISIRRERVDVKNYNPKTTNIIILFCYSFQIKIKSLRLRTASTDLPMPSILMKSVGVDSLINFIISEIRPEW